MNRLHGLRVALICACALAAGCQGSDGGVSGEAPAAIATTTPDSGAAPPINNAGTRSVTVNWAAPLENVDGTALTDLAGFVIVYGTSNDALSKTVYIDNPSIDRYLLEDLSAGTWYFGVKAYSATGEESELSSLMSKTID